MASTVKRFALFLDGTWNNINDSTNVWRLKSLCKNTAEQKVYYSAGVGTQKGEKLLGGMFGMGINEEVISAYEWLVENYEIGGHIYIFGFSRGAFTARSLAGFISKCGLLKLGSPLSLNQLYKRYRRGTSASIRSLLNTETTPTLSPEDKWLKKYSQPIPIYFQGVWDTVGSLGVPFPFIPHVNSHDFAFLETDLHIDCSHAYHALAIDEHRKAFKPTLWVKNTPSAGDSYPPRNIYNVEQRWFVGAHANVGGGYENDSLAQIPAKWLMDKSIEHELEFNNLIELDGDEEECPIHDSLAEMALGIYKAIPGTKYYRPIGQKPQKTPSSTLNNINETIDKSVFFRWNTNKNYRPKNLEQWAATHKINLETIKTSVRTDDPFTPLPDKIPNPNQSIVPEATN